MIGGVQEKRITIKNNLKEKIRNTKYISAAKIDQKKVILNTLNIMCQTLHLPSVCAVFYVAPL